MDFATREEVINDGLGQLPSALPRHRLTLHVQLAWHLRQRDTRAALAHADAAAALLADASAGEQASAIARLQLVRGEAAWLGGDLAEALRFAEAADPANAAATPPLVRADAQWLRAWVHNELGRMAERDHHFQHAADAAGRAGDRQRQQVVMAAQARFAAFTDLNQATGRWAGLLADDGIVDDPVVAVWTLDFAYVVASKQQDVGRAVRLAAAMFDQAMLTGQVQRAITAASNAGFDLTRIKDFEAALGWMQKGVDLARRAGWPASIGMCLIETAETLRQLKQPAMARDLLHEALQALGADNQSRRMALALNYLGDVELDSGRYDAALEAFDALHGRARLMQQADLQAIALRGRAQALARLGRHDEALAAAREARQLALEQQDLYNEVAALRAIADIHLDRMAAGDGTLDHHAEAVAHLQRALAVGDGIEGYRVPAEIHETLARQYARIGHYEAAYRAQLAALAARDHAHNENATHLAIALQIRHETDRLRQQGEHHRQLAKAQGERARVLQQTGLTLELLADLGRELTAHLDEGAILQTLSQKVDAMLDATSFAIYLYDASGDALVSVLLREHGRKLPTERIAVDDPVRHAATCFREGREILLRGNEGQVDPSHVPGTLLTESALFIPLIARRRTVGVATVQSMREDAYGERERLILRQLGAYAAIALTNADAYRRLAMAETSLRESQQRYARVVNTISDALASTDTGGRITYANARLRALFGLAPDAVAGTRLGERVAPDDRAAFDAAWDLALSGQAPPGIELRILTEDAEPLWMEARLTPICDDTQVDGVQAVFRDIRVRRKAEAEMLQNLQRERELVDLKSRFVAMASHEFRTPLAGMASSITLLRHYADRMAADERAALLDQMDEAIGRMTTLLDNVLLIGKGEATGLRFAPEAVDLAALAHGVADEVERASAARGRLQRCFGALPRRLRLDPALMRHMLGNILSNALKYSPAGGDVAFSAHAEGDAVVLAVRDRGSGIPAADLPHLFGGFYRAGNVGAIPGTGLGLAIVKQAVDLHGGTITVESRDGRGTCFRIVLPALPSDD